MRDCEPRCNTAVPFESIGRKRRAKCRLSLARAGAASVAAACAVITRACMQAVPKDPL